MNVVVGLFLKKSRQVFFAGKTDVVFADVEIGKKDSHTVSVIARTIKEPDERFDISAIMAGSGRKRGKVTLVMPLQSFELVSITVPPVGREAIAKMLPYSLSKVLDKSVSEYIYDWQVAQTFKDRHELNVFLYSAPKFEEYRSHLMARQKEIAWFEADVFAACSYISSFVMKSSEEAFLCVLMWSGSISLAVFENNRVALVRCVDVTMPEGSPTSKAEVFREQELLGESDEDLERGEEDLVMAFFPADEEPLVEAGELAADTQPSTSFRDGGIDDVLAGFGLQVTSSTEDDTPFVPGEVEFRLETEEVEVDLWREYLDTLSLEIMRTMDYHTSVLKGTAIQELFLGGAEGFFAPAEEAIRAGQDIKVTRFPPQEIEATLSPTLAAICVGAAVR